MHTRPKSRSRQYQVASTDIVHLPVQLLGCRGNVSKFSIRETVTIEAGVRTIWEFVGSPHRLSTWRCPPPTVEIEFEGARGGHFEERYEDGERRYDLAGVVEVYAPPERLIVRRDTEDEFGAQDTIAISLTATGARTRVTIDQSFSRLPATRRKAAIEFFAPGWRDSSSVLR